MAVLGPVCYHGAPAPSLGYEIRALICRIMLVLERTTCGNRDPPRNPADLCPAQARYSMHCQVACFRLRLLSRCPNPMIDRWNTRFHLPNRGFSRAHNMWKLRRASKLTLLMPRHGLGTVLPPPAGAGLCRAAPGLNRGSPGSVTHRRRAFCEENPQRLLPYT